MGGRDQEGAVLRKMQNIMLAEGKVCCQKVVTSSQVNEAKCNHDRDDEGMREGGGEGGGENRQSRCLLLKMKMSQTPGKGYTRTRTQHAL